MTPIADSSFFTAVAESAAALLGLSFLALSFFLTSLFPRYSGLALPVHLESLRSRLLSLGEGQLCLPQHVTDFRLFDSDPLIVFSAFSVGVSWNMYFVGLVVSLTALSGKFDNPWVYTAELSVFWCFLTFSLTVRNMKRDQLATYRTRDEKLWEVFEWMFILLWWLGAVFTFITAFYGDTVTWILKAISLGGLFFGLYVTNKDFFVYFKSRTSDEMRGKWLHQFITHRYQGLKNEVDASLAKASEPQIIEIESIWNEGCPPAVYVRDGFSPANGKPDARWRCLLAGGDSVASWMFDVPGIDLWVANIEKILNRMKSWSESGQAEPVLDTAALGHVRT